MSEYKESNYLNKSIAELIYALCHHAQPGSQRYEEIKGALYVALIDQLCNSMDRHEQAATKLSNRILWLNVILGIFTIVGAVLAVFSFIG